MNTSNWLDDTQRILIGGKPRTDADMHYLLECKKVTVFVNLTTSAELNHRQNFKYHEKLADEIRFIHFPIRDMGIGEDDSTQELVERIVKQSETDIIYVHCKGGHGRAGTIAGLLMHKLYPRMSYKEILIHIQKQHSVREYKPNSSTPQTSVQYNQLHRIITGSTDILFYDKICKYYVFSNFYNNKKGLHLFVDSEGREWNSTEAYYQAQKFIGLSVESDEYAEIIRKTKSPHFAYLLGNMRGNIRPSWSIDGESILDIIKRYKTRVKIVDGWESKKEGIMREALMYKFNQNPELREILLNSNGSLVEYTPRDSYWGTYWNKPGKNRLGKLLECVRTELRGK